MEAIAIDTLIHEREREDGAEPVVATLVLSTAETAPCTCPEWCERDHDVD